MAHPEWALNVQNRAERFVFKMVDERLKKLGEQKFYDIYLLWSMHIEQNWRGVFSTSVGDGIFYEVTYNTGSKATKLDVYQSLGSYVFPD